MHTEIQYRTFDELLDSVKIDLQRYSTKGVIESQQLIKVAMRVSYNLGLKVNPSRSKTIEVVNGKAKLPNDFYVLNFALLCQDKTEKYNWSYNFPEYKTYCQGVLEGERISRDTNLMYTTTVDLTVGRTNIPHCLNTNNYIIQAIDPEGHIIEFDIEKPDVNNAVIINQSAVALTDITVTIIGGYSPSELDDVLSELNPCPVAEVSDRCSNTCILDTSSNCVNETSCEGDVTFTYNTIIPLRIEKTKTLSNDSFNIMSTSVYTGMLKNKFLVTNFTDGTIYLNYQSLMENDEGELLIMSHPLVDEYYEYALKQRIYENLYLNGEPSIVNMLNLVENKLRISRNNALSYINTPDFSALKKMWEANRKAQYHKYYNMFKS